jgi:chorismate mutase
MPEPIKPQELIQIINSLQRDLESAPVDEPGGLDPQLALLRNWQAERLASSYADLLKSGQYRALGQFFLDDIYAARDFQKRDRSAEQFYEMLSRYLPASMLWLLADTIKLNRLSNQLDHALLRMLVERLGITTEITHAQYSEAYRLCDNFDARKQQIDLLVKILNEVAVGMHNPLVEITLRLARWPARRTGWADLYDFLARGYMACKPVRNFDFFIGTVKERETQILARIYANHPEPFLQ